MGYRKELLEVILSTPRMETDHWADFGLMWGKEGEKKSFFWGSTKLLFIALRGGI